MPGRAFLVAALIACSAPAWTQYASEFADIADAASVSYAQANWLILGVAGTLPPGSALADATAAMPERARRRGRSDEQSVTAGALAQMLLTIEEIAPGFWHAIAPGRLTAFSLVRSRGLIPPGWRSGTVPTGAQAVDVVRRYFEFARTDGPVRTDGPAR